MRQSNSSCPFTVFKLKSSDCQHRLQSEGPLVRSYRTVRLKTRSKILRLMSFNWKRSCQHRLSPTSPLWNHPPPSSSFSAFLEPVIGAQGINYPLVWLGIEKKSDDWQVRNGEGCCNIWLGIFRCLIYSRVFPGSSGFFTSGITWNTRYHLIFLVSVIQHPTLTKVAKAKNTSQTNFRKSHQTQTLATCKFFGLSIDYAIKDKRV